MKKITTIIIFLLISNLIFAGKPILELNYSKSGGGIGALFNLYGIVDIEWIAVQGGGQNGWLVNVDCRDHGFQRCRVKAGTQPQTIPEGMTGDMFDYLMEEAAELELYSEQQAKDGDIEGSESTIIAVVNGDETYYYLITAVWEYEDEDATDGTVIIKIFETDEI